MRRQLCKKALYPLKTLAILHILNSGTSTVISVQHRRSQWLRRKLNSKYSPTPRFQKGKNSFTNRLKQRLQSWAVKLTFFKKNAYFLRQSQRKKPGSGYTCSNGCSTSNNNTSESLIMTITDIYLNQRIFIEVQLSRDKSKTCCWDIAN